MSTQVTSRLRNLRIAPRKVRLVAALISGRPLNEAISELQFLMKRSAMPLAKLLKAAAADAEHNFKLSKDDLVVERITVNSGPTLRRYTPKAFGRAAPIRKRSSHVEVTLISRTGAKVSKATGQPTIGSVEPSSSSTSSTDRQPDHRAVPRSTKPRGGMIGKVKNRLFSRKTG